MDFNFDKADVVFIQQDVSEGSYGRSYDKDDAMVSFYRSGGIEYIIVENRFDIVQITWLIESKLFTLSANIPVETALEIAQKNEGR